MLMFLDTVDFLIEASKSDFIKGWLFGVLFGLLVCLAIYSLFCLKKRIYDDERPIPIADIEDCELFDGENSNYSKLSSILMAIKEYKVDGEEVDIKIVRDIFNKYLFDNRYRLFEEKSKEDLEKSLNEINDLICEKIKE